jgi:altronate dehydratase small subunit
LKKQAIVIDTKDNVATLVDDFTAGTIIHYALGAFEGTVQLRQDTPIGHKCAICEIPSGADVIKYGESIGRATANINPGEHVHVHNVESRRGGSGPGK